MEDAFQGVYESEGDVPTSVAPISLDLAVFV